MDLPDVEVRALNVALNSPQLAGDFTDGLGDILAEVEAGMPDLFAAVRLDALRASSGLSSSDGDGEDGGAPPLPEEPVSSRGEVYELGPHRVVCGDCRDPQAWDVLLGDRRANVAITSPPYAQQRRYDPSSGFRPVPADRYVEWFEQVQRWVRRHLAEDGSWFVNIKPHCEDGQRVLYVMDLVLAHVREWGWRYNDEYVWIHHGIPQRVWAKLKNQFEPVHQFCLAEKIKIRPGNVAHRSESVPQRGGGCISGMREVADPEGTAMRRRPGMAYPGNVIHAAPNAEAVGHSAAFPVSLPEFFIRAFSDPGDVVCDPFLGSGTTLVAAARAGRTAAGIEISPAYVDVIRRRWTAWADKEGIPAGKGALR